MAVRTINLAVYPQVLTVLPDDTVRVVTEFDYVGPAISARMISAIWHPTLLDPHNEIVRGNKSFSIPSSLPPGNHITVTMDLLVPSGEVGTDYGLYSSIRDVPGPDIYTNYYPNLITIEEVVPEFKGTISKKELEYNQSRGTIPVSNVPQGERGLVHVWGRNDMAISQKLGISWVVKDPTGLIVESYSDWQTFSATPGGTHEFIGGRFDLNKEGTYTLAVGLFMNQASPVQVASYNGSLCTVKAPPPAEYTLEVTIEPPGAGHVLISPKAPYSAGEVVTLVATPYSGYEFDHWGGWPAYPGVGSTSSTLKLTMTANWWVVATFRAVAPPPAEYTLEVTIEPPGSGYVTKSPSKAKYSAGEVVTLTAYPYSGYDFDHWGGWPPYPGVGSTSRTLKITMDADWWVVAAFQKEEAPPPPPPPECTPGRKKCVGDDLYTCSGEGRWVLTERNSPFCVTPPPECTPGQQRCIGPDLYECSREGKWVLVEGDSPQCPV